MEDKKASYEPLILDIVAFCNEDIIITSGEPTRGPYEGTIN